MSKSGGLLDSLAHMFKSSKGGEATLQGGNPVEALQVDFDDAVRRWKRKSRNAYAEVFRRTRARHLE
jgi:hypothetical protein